MINGGRDGELAADEQTPQPLHRQTPAGGRRLGPERMALGECGAVHGRDQAEQQRAHRGEHGEGGQHRRVPDDLL
jgi:hypothetical protein